MSKLFAIAILLSCALPSLAEHKCHDLFKSFKYEGQGINASRYPESLDSLRDGCIAVPGWASDPSICRVGNDYWLVTSTFGYFPGVPLYHSTDLIHWELVRNIIDRKSQLPECYEPGARSLDKGGIYAATIRYNEHNKTYYMITTDVAGENTSSLPSISKGGDGAYQHPDRPGGYGGHFFMTAKDPRGEWSDATPLPAIDGIDPSFFFDTDSSAYIIYKEDVVGQPKWNNHRALRIIRFDVEKGCTIGEPVNFLEEGVGPEEHLARDEGPHIYKVDGKYYVVAAEGGTGMNHSAVCYKADNPLGPYARWPRNPMLTQRDNKDRPYAVTCTGHADMVQTPDGKWYAVFLGMRPHTSDKKAETSTDLGRETFLMPVKWSRDGFPYITMDRDTVPNISASLTWTDDFASAKKAPQWLTVPNIPGYHGIRLQHQVFDIETQIDLKALAKESSRRLKEGTGKQRAGLMFLKTEAAQYRCLTDGSTISLLQIGKNSKATTLATTSIQGNPGDLLTLRVKSDGSTLTFTYSADSTTETVIGQAPVNILSARAGGFTGITVGLYKE